MPVAGECRPAIPRAWGSTSLDARRRRCGAGRARRWPCRGVRAPPRRSSSEASVATITLPQRSLAIAALFAVLVHLARALDAQARLQRAGHVVDAGVDHAGVVAGLVGADVGLALEHAHRRAWIARDQLARDRETDDPAADDRQVAALGRARRLIAMWAALDTATVPTAPGPPGAVAAAASSEPGAVQAFVAAAAEFARGRAQPRDDLGGRGMAPEHAAGDHQRGRRGDVRRRHRGAFVAGGHAEAAQRAAGERHLVDVAAGGFFGVAVGVARQVGVGAAAGRDERQAAAVVGVGGQAAVFGRRADGDHVGRARGVGDRGVALVAGGGDDEHAAAVRVAQRVDQLGDVRGRHAGGELEAEVDHLSAVLDGEEHAFGDRRGFAFALGVEHAHGHDVRAEGEPGKAVAVVGGLGDRGCDERPVAVAVVRVGVVRDEVIALGRTCSGLKSGERRNGPRLA